MEFLQQIEEKEQVILHIREQIAEEEKKLKKAVELEKELKSKLAPAKGSKKKSQKDQGKKELNENIRINAEELKQIRVDLLSLKQKLHDTIKEKVNIKKRFNAAKGNKPMYLLKQDEDRNYDEYQSFSNADHQPGQWDNCNSGKDDSQKFTDCTTGKNAASSSAAIEDAANVNVNEANEQCREIDEMPSIIGKFDLNDIAYLNSNKLTTNLESNNTVKDLLLSLVALLMPETREFQELKAENFALKLQLSKCNEQMQLIGRIRNQSQIMQDHVRKNNVQLEALKESANYREQLYIDLLEMPELSVGMELLHNDIINLADTKSISVLNFEESELQLEEEKKTVPESDNQLSNDDSANPNAEQLEEEISIEKALRNINRLIRKFETLIIFEYKKSDEYVQSISVRDNEIGFLKRFISQYMRSMPNPNRKRSNVDNSRHFDVEEVLDALEMSQLRTVNLSHQLALKDMELRQLMEETSEHFCKAVKDSDSSEVQVPKSTIMVSLQKDLPNESMEVKIYRAMLRKERETTFILKTIQDRLYDIITVEYKEKWNYYKNRVETLRTKRELTKKEMEAEVYCCLKVINAERGTRFSKIDLETIHIEDVIEVFNRTMRLKPDCLCLISEIEHFIESQLKVFISFIFFSSLLLLSCI